jgi:hypothetical protein
MVPFVVHEVGLVLETDAVVAICVKANPAFDQPPPSEMRYSKTDDASR